MIDVYKFGGVAVGSAEALRTAASHIEKAEGPLVVVVSAMNGVTDLLFDTARAALRGDRDAYTDGAAAFARRHEDVVRALFQSKARGRALRAAIDESSRELLSMAESIATLRELTVRATDAVVARGERLLARIFTELLLDGGADATYVDATEVILTEHRLGSLWPDFTRSERAAKKIVLPLLEQGRTVVVPGYIGSGPSGEVVTLGRGGSDFSAATFARVVGARSVTLFKEVDGLMTADPKSVPSARPLAELHYREAAELAYYGAKVLHPRTMIPLVDRKIPLHVRNTFREGSPGTRIAHDVVPGNYPVKALTAIRQQSLIAIEGSGMIGVPGVAARTFTALAGAGHSVTMISQASSEASICFVLPAVEADHAIAALKDAFALERKARLIDRIHATDSVALIAVVGLGMRGRPGIAARTFSALSGAGVNIVAIAQGSSELNITMAVAETDATLALQTLHAEFQLDRLHPLADSSGRESKLTLLGFGQIGRTLTAQLVAQQERLRTEHGVDIRVSAIADRSGIKVEGEGFSRSALLRLSKKKATGERLFGADSPLTLQQIQNLMRGEVWLLPSHRPILVDLTSEETAPLIQEALEHGFHVVLANKKPLTVPQIEYDRLLQTARERGLAIRYEATAGAGLPVFDTLAKLQESGDRISSVLGCFSGTLGFVMTAIQDGRRFSEAVREAWKKGFTEPDPRDDLSGTDVARKALIIARTLGRRVELSDVKLEPLFGREADDPDPERFVEKLGSLDDAFAERLERARREGNVLRYVATVGPRSIEVGLKAVPEASPLGRLRGTDNQVVIHTKRYSTNPLVVTGPGAGAAVTAAGVLNDIVAITKTERRTRPR